jgi:Trk K+ transport system NAD-binding subunit
MIFFLGSLIHETLSDAGFVVVGIATDSEQALAMASSQLSDLAVYGYTSRPRRWRR